MIYTRNQSREGFTLIELMIAIAIFAIISIAVVPNFLRYLEEAKVSRAQANLLSIKSALTQYNLSIGKWPSRLKDLVQPPADEREKAKWSGSFFDKKELPEDPWENNYQYKLNPAGSENPYELYSYGKTGKGAPQGEWISVWKL